MGTNQALSLRFAEPMYAHAYTIPAGVSNGAVGRTNMSYFLLVCVL